VPVAINDSVYGAAEQGLGCGSQVLASLRRKEGIVHQRAVAEVNDASVTDGCTTVNVDGSIDTVGQLLEPKMF
jgi:hypothetical protein